MLFANSKLCQFLQAKSTSSTLLSRCCPSQKLSLTTLQSIPHRVHIKLQSTELGQVQDEIALWDLEHPRQDTMRRIHHMSNLEFSRGCETRLTWSSTPKTILLVKKPNDETVERVFLEATTWLRKEYPDTHILVKKWMKKKYSKELDFAVGITKEDRQELQEKVDLVVTFGGDGTMLHVAPLFEAWIPPILSFSLGTLGFLLPFHIREYQNTIRHVMLGKTRALLRMRLACRVVDSKGLYKERSDIDTHAINEILFHRGESPRLMSIRCYVNDQHLTDAVADGLIVATPTGSTAYSLAAGGSIVHPSVRGILLTPICPHSLSFRPLILPTETKIKLTAVDHSQVSIDGREVCSLVKEESIQVTESKYPMICVRSEQQQSDEWISDITDMLRWNQKYLSRFSPETR